MLFWNKFLMVITCCCCLDKYPRMCKSSINILNLGVFFKQLALSWFSRYFSFDMEVKLDCCHKTFPCKGLVIIDSFEYVPKSLIRSYKVDFFV